MIYFLYGDNTFLSRQKLAEITDGYKKAHASGLNFQAFDMATKSLDEFKEFVQAQAMFQEKKLGILSNVFSKNVDEEKLLELFKKQNIVKESSVIIIVIEGGVPKGSAYKYFLDNAHTQEFKNLDNLKLERWVVSQFQKQGIQVAPAVAQQLILMVGFDMWQLSSEIDKLATWRADIKKVSTDDLTLMIKGKIESDMFKTIDALAGGQRQTALRLLHQHIAQGEKELYILSMFAYQFRNLLKVKDLSQKGESLAGIVKKTKLHPYVAKKSLMQSQRFNINVLKSVYQRILDLDIKIKTGQIEPVEALDGLIFSLT